MCLFFLFAVAVSAASSVSIYILTEIICLPDFIFHFILICCTNQIISSTSRLGPFLQYLHLVIRLKAREWSGIICWEKPDHVTNSDSPKSLISHAASGSPCGYRMRNVFNQRFKCLFIHHNSHLGANLKPESICSFSQACICEWQKNEIKKKMLPTYRLNQRVHLLSCIVETQI